MRLCLLMMVTAGEAPYLRMNLPHIANEFDGVVVVWQRGQDIEQEVQVFRDSVQQSERLEWIVRDWHNDWSEFLNAGIEMAEQSHYDAVMRLDPDETLFSADVSRIRALLEQYDIVAFPRRNFFGDRLHYATSHWPDYQRRGIRLHKGTRYKGQHHEGPHCEGPHYVAEDIVIYHYGWVGKPRIRERALHYMNVAREGTDLPKLTEYPPEAETPVWPTEPYDGPQPVDPREVGIFAPWSE